MSESSSASPSSARRSTRRAHAARSGSAPPPHVRHLLEHLERLGQGVLAVPDPERVYLGSSAEEHLWEIVGFRLTGHPRLVLAALKFRRLHLPGEAFGRESLKSYLSSPPTPSPADPGPRDPGEVSALLPRWQEAIPAFLARLRGGPMYAPVHVRPDQIQLAFDFRLKNPWGLEAQKLRAGPLVPHLFRTTAGHILEGSSHGPGGRSARGDFIAVRGCEQLTPTGRLRLPAVMLHRRFVAMSVAMSDERTRLAAPNWAPFLPETGSKRHILLG